MNVFRRAGDGVKMQTPRILSRDFFSANRTKFKRRPSSSKCWSAIVRCAATLTPKLCAMAGALLSSLVPYHPDQVSVWRIPGTRDLLYDFFDLDGRRRRLLPEQVLHLRDRSDDGIIGKSRLQRARESIGTAIAVERHAASTFKNGAKLSGVLSHPSMLSETAHQNIVDSFSAKYTGSDKAGSVAVLEEGMRWQATSVSAEDAELLASRRFGTETICRIFRVPLPLVGDISNGSYSNVVELNRMFATHCLTPWIVRLEQTIERDLLSEEGQRTHLVEIDQDGLLRGDMLARWQSYRIMREIGGASANEIRGWEKINRRTDPDGDNISVR